MSDQVITDLLLDVVLIIFLIIMFELCHWVLNFPDELISWVLHNDFFVLLHMYKSRKLGGSSDYQPCQEHKARHIVTCKFSDLKISPTASICLMILFIFSFSSSRYCWTDLWLDRDASWSLSSFLSACMNWWYPFKMEQMKSQNLTVRMLL